MTTLLDAISSYLLTPETFWPDDHYFHRRNRDKIGRVRAKLGVKTRADVEAYVLPGLLARAREGSRSLFLISCGASGDDLVGALIASAPRYRLVGEVYFPEALVKLAESLSDPVEARALMDCVSALPMGPREMLSPARIPVNVMHLRPDSPLEQIRALLPGARQVALLRNPYDVAVSRSFRKQTYRQAANPGMSDTEYAAMQSRYVRNIFSLMKQKHWNARIRYEDLQQDPPGQVLNLLQRLRLPVDGIDPDTVRSAAVVPRSKPVVPARIQALFREILSHTVASWDYEMPPEIAARAIVPLHVGPQNLWRPMQSTLLTPQMIEQVRREKVLFVGPRQASFVLRDGIEGIGLETRPPVWKQQFWSLCWLHLVEHLKRGASLQEDWFWRLLDMADGYLQEPATAPADFWDGAATARRAATLLWFVYKYSDKPEMEQRIDQLDRLFQAHLERLEEGLTTMRGTGSAQSLALALGYISLLIHAELPGLDGRSERLQYGLDQLATDLSDLVDPESGITREQCFHNQLQTIGQVADVADALDRMGLDIGFDCRGMIDGMLACARFFAVGGQCLPAIGDTPFEGGYDKSYLEAKERELLGRVRDARSLEIGVTQGQCTTVLGPDDDDLGAIRRHYREGEGASLVVMMAGKDRRPHGHFDALSVWFTRQSQPLLVDSGGPYAYDQQLRFDYFLTSRAHNTVLVDGADYRGGARMLRHGGSASGQVLLAEIADKGNMAHQRLVALRGDDELIVVDRLTSLDEAEHRLNLLYHFAPEAQLTIEADQPVVRVGEAALWLATSGPDLALRSTAGDQDTEFPGWVTSQRGARQAAPVLVAETSGRHVFLVTVVAGKTPVSGVQLTGAGAAQQAEILYQTGERRHLPLEQLFRPDISDGDLAETLWPQLG